MSQTIDNIIYSDDMKTVEGVEIYEITTAVIKGGVTEIGEDAFRGCEYLQSVVIPEGVTTIGENAFDGCKIENYEHKIFKIKNGCFLSSDEKTVLYCTNASKQEIVIPEGVTEIGEDAFRGCANLQSVVIPEGVTEIGEAAFGGCENLQSVVIPESVATIGDKAFIACKIENYEHKLFKIKNGCFLSSDEKTVLYRSNASKQEIVIPEGVTTIRYNAFYGCENLQSVVIPEGVTEIGEYAFDDCTNLTVTFDGTKEEWEKIKGDGKPEDVKFNK